MKAMRRYEWYGAAVVVIVLAVAGAAATPALALEPWWHLTTSARPAVLKPGSQDTIGFRALNIGDAPTSTENAVGEQTPVVVEATLPAGLSVQRVPGHPTEPDVTLHRFPETELGNSFCSEPSVNRIRCSYETFFGPVLPYEFVEMSAAVDVEGSATTGLSTMSVTGGGATDASSKRRLAVDTAPPAFGVEEQSFSVMPEEEGGAVDARAGSHPYQLTTNFALNQTADPVSPPAMPKDLKFTLPPGLVANAATFPRCSEAAFLAEGPGNGFADLCANDTAVGVVDLTIREPEFGNRPTATYPVPVFNLNPKQGEPARFGFYFNGLTVTIDFSLRTGGDYGATATVSNITEISNFLAETLTIWGVPGESTHDTTRGWGCVAGGFYQFNGSPPCNPAQQTHPAPFLTLPTSCASPFNATVEGDSWPTKADPEGKRLAEGPQNSTSLHDESGRPLGITSCNQLPFSPFIEVAPDVQEASTSTGLSVHVRVPQEANGNAQGLASSSVKDITVALPEGFAINPAGANGLDACSEAGVGFLGQTEFNPETEHGNETMLFTSTLPSPFCPTAAKVGTVEITSPLLPPTQHVKGAVYIATQNQNPFGSLIAMYIVAEDPVSGVLVKLPGEVHLTDSGQLVTTFKNSPQVPFEDAELHFFGGERAPLSTPSHCGSYTTNATFAPWSGQEPVASQSHFEITAGPRGGPCPGAQLPFSPSITGGTMDVNAGRFSPLTTTIGREDGNQDLQSVQLHMPAGLEGILKGVKLCPEAQANEGSCGPESQIGETTVSAGVGSDPVSIKGGKVYLTEKYRGAPFGLSIVNPVKAGPFDLEHDTSNPSQQPACDCLVVRAKIDVDPHTAVLTVTTDQSGPHAIPHLIDGVPAQIQKVNVLINRDHFTFNPTNCSALNMTSAITSDGGAIASPAVPFVVTNCAGLKFTPKFSVATAAKSSKANGASLVFKISYPAGAMGTQSWFKEAKFDIPKQLPARLTTLQKACLAKVFEANPAACPAASLIGHAVVHTPVLPVPLVGPVYFVSYGNLRFPNAVVVLQGYGVTVDLVGETFINSKTGVTSATFATTPDVPFESIEVTIPRGPTSEFGANLPASAKGSFCGQKLKMPVEFKAQNGLKIHRSVPVAVTGCAKAKALSRAQKLAKALHACKKKPKAKRAACVRRARSKYAPRKKHAKKK